MECTTIMNEGCWEDRRLEEAKSNDQYKNILKKKNDNNFILKFIKPMYMRPLKKPTVELRLMMNEMASETYSEVWVVTEVCLQ